MQRWLETSLGAAHGGGMAADRHRLCEEGGDGRLGVGWCQNEEKRWLGHGRYTVRQRWQQTCVAVEAAPAGTTGCHGREEDTARPARGVAGGVGHRLDSRPAPGKMVALKKRTTGVGIRWQRSRRRRRGVKEETAWWELRSGGHGNHGQSTDGGGATAAWASGASAVSDGEDDQRQRLGGWPDGGRRLAAAGGAASGRRRTGFRRPEAEAAGAQEHKDGTGKKRMYRSTHFPHRPSHPVHHGPDAPRSVQISFSYDFKPV